MQPNMITQLQDTNGKRLVIFFAWTTMFLLSDLPDIIWNMFFGQVPESMIWIKVCFMALLFAFCRSWKKIRPLWEYTFILFVFSLALAVSSGIGKTDWWQSQFLGQHPTFILRYTGIYIRDIGVTLVVIISLWVIKRRRKDFFLTKGQLDAPIEPVRWLRIRQGESWRIFGWIFACIAGFAVLIPTVLAGRPTTEMILRVVPFLPAVVLFAAINAFNEEIYFRVSFLSTLQHVVGKTHALLITVVFFGLAHYLYGSPPGVLGFLMTGFLAWLLGKSILETKGLLWAWVIHFIPDVVIFASYVIF